MRSTSSANLFYAGLLGSALLHFGMLLGLSGDGYTGRTIAGTSAQTPRHPASISLVTRKSPGDSSANPQSETHPPQDPPVTRVPYEAAQQEGAASVGSAASSAASSIDPLLLTADDFVPRRFLTVAPRARTDITVFYPEDSSSVGKRTAVLSLFIDELGTVQRVRVDGPPLPREMEDAARTAFLNARFSAGEIEGRIVKSWIKVEVTFESTPPSTPTDAPKPPENH